MPVGVFRTWVKYVEKGEFPHTSRHFGVMRCNHCDDAPCIEICPTHALYRRHDGIVDFDNTRCIGCKGCMQACPYDALYIDPNSNTAAKCNFCAHRVENNMEPACVIVCPTQAIFAGDLDDAGSEVSRIVATQKTSVRKPEKNTKPKLFYVGIEPDLLDPTRLSRQVTDMFSDRRVKPEASQAADAALTREVYDVAHPAPWGWKIAAYLWTKSIASGVMLVAAIVMFLSGENSGTLSCVTAPLVALVALAVTSALLIFDLKRPGRFFYLLTKPNFKSWLVLGAYVLMAYGVLTAVWLWFGMVKHYVPGAVSAATAVLAVGSACYSAFLFAQAKGRDLWQSPMFFFHLLIHAVICGSATLFFVGLMTDDYSDALLPLYWILVVSLIASLILIFAEVVVPHGSEDVRLALRVLTRGRLSVQFWGLAIGIGILFPLGFVALLMLAGVDFAVFLLPLHALAGVWFFEDVWVKAGQAVPLS